MDWESKPRLLAERPRQLDEPSGLSEQDRERIVAITRELEAVPPTVTQSQLAHEHIFNLLENGSPLNRIWRNEAGELIGYLACELPDEHGGVYVAAVGVDRNHRGEIGLMEIGTLIDEAVSEKPYMSLFFHGFNPRLNQILERRYGFKQAKERPEDWFEGQRVPRLYLNLNDLRRRRERDLRASRRLEVQAMVIEGLRTRRGDSFTDEQGKTVKRKLKKYLDSGIDPNSLNPPTVVDAIGNFPDFLGIDSNLGLARVLELEEQRVAKVVAELRRKEASGEYDDTREDVLVQEGDYRLVRLRSKSDLELESAKMGHCVGTSDSYLKGMQQGEIEIWSFRDNDGHPILTVEYDTKGTRVNQIKKANDDLLNGEEEYFAVFLKLLTVIEEIEMADKRRRRIEAVGDLEDIALEPGRLLTLKGLVDWREYDEETHGKIFAGKIELDNQAGWEEVERAASIGGVTVEWTEVKPELKSKVTEIKGSLIDESWVVNYELLTSIGGKAYFGNLTSADGLSRLTSIGGEVDFGRLIEATGLAGLTSIGGRAYFGNLTSADGLSRLTRIGGRADFWSLTSAKGLAGLTSIGGEAHFEDLTDAAGLAGLASIGGEAHFESLTGAEVTKLLDGGLEVKKIYLWFIPERMVVKEKYPNLIIYYVG